ncbi:hypothetical protein Syun_022282 [Stephania yunnanensis]|uniref:DUF1308 domain-containing protein n=1 Tax=Stephania yunnanensis TaxID=152371 RepID=A0AAP0F7P6_9MAGN
MMKVEEAERRCRAALDVVHSNITDSSCNRTLLRLINSELKFLSTTSTSTSTSSPAIISSNIGYLESLLHILRQPLITGVSRISKSLPSSNGVHVDIVCSLNKSPVWILVSARNPNYISWSPSSSHKNKGLRRRVDQVMEAARSASTLKPASLILFFSNGLDDTVSSKLQLEFGASQLELGDGWVHVDLMRSYAKARAFQIKVDACAPDGLRLLHVEDHTDDHQLAFAGNDFCSLMSTMRLGSLEIAGEDLINFDTTALIALVSGISNGGADNLIAAPESELRARFKCNYDFVIAQAMSELQNPLFEELRSVISHKIGIVCESVVHEFKELVAMCGGPNERSRAHQLLKKLVVVPDNPSARMSGLPTTRKIAMKNKVVFGTGDCWSAPTLTANAGFVRAIAQTGMSLLTIQHRPRALTGD